MRRFSILMAVALILSLAGASALSAVPPDATGSPHASPRLEFELAAADVTDRTVRAAIEERFAYGFDWQQDTVESLLGSEQLGMVLSDGEADIVRGRLELQAAVTPELADAARSLVGFAGLYFDHSDNGRLVVQTTRSAQDTAAQLRAVQPDFDQIARVDSVQFDRTELEKGVGAAWDVAARLIPDATTTSVSIDSTTNSVLLRVLQADLDVALAQAAEIEREIGVGLTVSVGEIAEPSVCTSRENCYSPMKAGILIRRGSTTAPRCTMGFHVQQGSDELYVTAGHCDEGAADYWYHKNFNQNDCGTGFAVGCIGRRAGTLLANNGSDVAMMQMADDQDSSSVYANSTPASGWWWPIQNEGACSSLGMTGAWDCGTVSDDYYTYNLLGSSGQWYYQLVGADHNGIAGVKGDSGSPIVRQANTGTAIGIASTTGGAFARFGDAANAFSISIRT